MGDAGDKRADAKRAWLELSRERENETAWGIWQETDARDADG